MTDAQVSAVISYLDWNPRPADSAEAASHQACAEQWRMKAADLERKLENARFFLAVACVAAALAYAAWWAGQ